MYKKLFLAICTAITCIATTHKTFAFYKNNASVNIEQENIIQRTYKLHKFTQTCCARIIEYSLKEVEGFIKHESDVKKQEITVWFNSSLCSEQDIKDAINKTSYRIIE